MLTAEEFAIQANSSKYTGVPYSKLDCQAFVEKVLADCGIRKPDGTVYNWRGSNHMWREALSWKGTIADCIKEFGDIPEGAWAFCISHDGGEVARGYHDDEGNAYHVGIYCRPNAQLSVRDSTKGSTRNGVGYRLLSDFTHVGFSKLLSYPHDKEEQPVTSSKEEALKALEVLTNYVKGV